MESPQGSAAHVVIDECTAAAGHWQSLHHSCVMVPQTQASIARIFVAWGLGVNLLPFRSNSLLVCCCGSYLRRSRGPVF